MQRQVAYYLGQRMPTYTALKSLLPFISSVSVNMSQSTTSLQHCHHARSLKLCRIVFSTQLVCIDSPYVTAHVRMCAHGWRTAGGMQRAWLPGGRALKLLAPVITIDDVRSPPLPWFPCLPDAAHHRCPSGPSTSHHVAGDLIGLLNCFLLLLAVDECTYICFMVGGCCNAAPGPPFD